MKTYRYEILIDRTLSENWTSWFAGMEITPEPGGGTKLVGALADQAALYGVLMKIRDLGLALVSIQRCEEAVPENLS